MKPIQSPLIFAGAICLAGLNLSPPLQAERVDGLEVRVGRTVEITRSHSWCWYPTIHRFRSGEILVAMNMSPDEVNSESSFSAYCISVDGGSTWSRRHTLGSGASQDGAWSEAPDREDSFWQMGSYPEPYREGDATRFYAVRTKFSRGGRRVSIDHDVILKLAQPVSLYPTWLFDYRFDGKAPVSDTNIKRQFSGRTWGGIIQGPNRDLLCGAYYTSAADAARATDEAKTNHKPRRYIHNVLLRSTDDGRTWLEYSTIASVPAGERPAWMGGEGPGEISLALLSDGRLYTVYRTGGRDGMIGNQWSSDGGKTWSAPASIGFQGVAPRLHRLENGMLALVTGRPGPLVLRFNLDGLGKRWSRPVVLFTGTTTHYADLSEIQPGKLLVVFDRLPYGWFEIPLSDRDARNTICGTFVDLKSD